MRRMDFVERIIFIRLPDIMGGNRQASEDKIFQSRKTDYIVFTLMEFLLKDFYGAYISRQLTYEIFI